MKNKTLILLAISKIIITLTMISADVITPGFHGISITNNITNIKDFPDYIFVSGGGISPNMCPMKIIDNSGIIEDYYKFCNVYVYAIPQEKFDANIINETNNNENITTVEAENLLKGLSGVKVLESISTYTEVADTSPIKEKINEYSIDINQLKSSPDNVKAIKNGLNYAYIFVPLVAITIIVLLLVKRKRK